MPQLWVKAIKNLIKRGRYKSKCQAIRIMMYPVLVKELERLDPEVKIEPFIEKKKVIKKLLNPALPRNLGYREPRRKKEWKVSVPRRAMERSGINQRKRKAKKIKKYAIPRFTVKKS
jgi:Arc/MetJ-type ribon-helix-helix transcriptional regulator